jgi:phospholipid/cholesterol/gamma-HCH transport system substrate-binding protein
VLVDRHHPPYKVAGAVLLVIFAVLGTLIYLQFRGTFTDKEQLTLLSSRAGLVVDPGSKVTYNGVEIGRVSRIGMIDVDGAPKAKLTLDVDPDYLRFIPTNVDTQIRATTVFGNKYISFSSPENPTPQRVSSGDVIDVSAVTTEFNTLFETVTSIAEQVDPVKLNQTLAATAEALTGLGDRFGESLLNGNRILDDLNQRMPQIRYDNQRLADLGDVYADASPDLWDGLENACERPARSTITAATSTPR